MDINSIPSELLIKRSVTECNFIFALYKEPLRIGDYKNVVNTEDVITDDGIFYYGLAQNMFKAGYQVFDNASIYDYLADKTVMRDGFERRGGYQTIKDISDVISIENIDIYYDELVKNNMLIRFYNAGFDVLKNLTKFQQMNSEEVYAYYEYQLSNIATGKIEKLKSEDLTEGYDYWIDEWDKGVDVGYKIGSGMLNYQLAGVHKKNLLLQLTGIGNGKTTSAIAWYILPAIETDDVCIIANEQDVSQWRQMILSTVAFNKTSTKVEGLNRHKMIVGGFTDEQKNKLREAAQWLKSQQGKIHFVETQDYSVNNIKKIMTRFSALGCSYFVVDTLKPADDSSERSWGEFSEVAKELFLLSKKLNVATVATCQLSPDAMSRRYLDLTCIGKSKAIAETATQVVMFRNITNEEKGKIFVYKFEGKVKKEIKLDSSKDYIMVFVPKNRYGQVNPQIVMERNMAFNTYYDVGWTECEYDQFRNR